MSPKHQTFIRSALLTAITVWGVAPTSTALLFAQEVEPDWSYLEPTPTYEEHLQQKHTSDTRNQHPSSTALKREKSGVGPPASSSLADSQSISSPKPVVFLIPYTLDMHLSDADAEWAQANRMSPSTVRAFLRYRLAYMLSVALMRTHRVVNPLIDTSHAVQEVYRFLQRGKVYFRGSAEAVHWARPPDSLLWTICPEDVRTTAQVSSTQQHNFGRTDSPIVTAVLTSSGTPSQTARLGPNYYLGVHLPHARDALRQIAQAHEIDYFLFLNELTVQTEHARCYDRRTGPAVQILAVHYSVYDADGKYRTGGTWKMLIPRTYVLAEVARKGFSPIVTRIARTIPTRGNFRKAQHVPKGDF